METYVCKACDIECWPVHEQPKHPCCCDCGKPMEREADADAHTERKGEEQKEGEEVDGT